MTNKTLDSKGRTALKCSAVLVALCAALMPEVIMAVGHWVPVATGAPNGNEIGTMLLLSDGTVMAQRLSNTYGDWYRLTPDNRGGYTNGTWTTLRSMNWPRLYYSSVVLRDGRVFVAGAEESLPGGGDTAEVYDPANDAAGWTSPGPHRSCAGTHLRRQTAQTRSRRESWGRNKEKLCPPAPKPGPSS